MDTTRPVWSIRPNWKDGILERLGWLTDILASDSSAEQRRSLRVSPRRSFEITVNPTNQERTFLDLMLHTLGSDEWLFPLWHDKAKLTAATTVGGTALMFDNTYREHNTEGFAILYKDAFTFEVVEITAQTDAGLTVSALENVWPVGTPVYPLRIATVDQQTSLRALTSRVGQSVLLFTMNEANDWPEVMPDDLSYGGLPVMTFAPNRTTEITSDHSRIAFEADGRVGLRERVDAVGRAFSVQSHNWIVRGRQAHSDFRSMLYWLRGRQRAVWLPTFNDDVVLSRDAVLHATNLDIYKIGMGYVGGVIPGRDHLYINGDCIQITSMGTALSAAEERIHVSALPHAVATGKTGSFMDVARLDQDEIELHHHTDSDGTMEVSSAFHTFSDSRAAVAPIYYPIPIGVMDLTPCGSPEGDNPCSRFFPGWYWKVVFKLMMHGGLYPYDFYDSLGIGEDGLNGDPADVISEEVIPYQRTFYLGTDYPVGTSMTSIQQLETANLQYGAVIDEPGPPPNEDRPMFRILWQHWDWTHVTNVAMGAQTRLPTPWVFPIPDGS